MSPLGERIGSRDLGALNLPSNPVGQPLELETDELVLEQLPQGVLQPAAGGHPPWPSVDKNKWND